MILSDKQIKKLCIPPTTFFDEEGYNERIRRGVALPSHEWAAARAMEELRQSFVRDTTEEERAAFVPMIAPFHPESIRRVEHRETRGGELCVDERKIISKGITSYGYDVSLAEEFKILTNIHSGVINPKRLDSKCLVDAPLREDEDGKYVIMPPNSYLLGRTNEYFRMPNDVLAIALGKSTYARAGAIVNVTPIEPGFEGHVVIEISNATNLPMMIFANEGISQFVFFRGEPCETSYADRGGKYQGQTGITLPRM